MAKTIRLSIPHQLSQQEARKRIETGIVDLRSRFGTKASAIEEKWTGDHLDFSVTAMNQQVSGQLEITSDQVQLEVNLPWMLAMLAGNFKDRVEQEGRKLLENKP